MFKVYKIDINSVSREEYEKNFESLPEIIKSRIKSKNTPLSQKQSMAGYLLLKRGINELYGKDMFDVSFNENGKPATSICNFSISHSENIAVCVFSDKEVGADIQKMRKIDLKSHYPLFTEEETDFINKEPSGANKRFFEVFTKKEALVKLYGSRLSECNKLSKENVDFTMLSEDDFILCIAEQRNAHK
ncbi:MAG: 4'-phosphopantetheinyl transferase superfamily protein [Clostridia bacterium]|nr:4'-phosphopantetheinyl transferase superfamily protein [Clostridia bacterium]